MSPNRADLVRQVRQHLETESSFGIFDVAKPFRQGASSPSKAEALKTLYEENKNCRLCPLGAARTHFVFGEGNPEARLMFVGEAPGYDEDQQGRPFVGAAGQLLTKIIQAMKLSREDVYIANCLKCRPPGNRNPLPTELATCDPMLRRQIEIIQPEILCTLGKFASHSVLNTEEPISRLRGRFIECDGIKIMPTFHPAYLLRNPGDKKLVWEDMQRIMRELRIS